MLKRKSKIETGLRAGKAENSILRLLRSDKGFAGSIDSLEGRDQERGFEGSWKETRNALMEAEFKSGQALLWQRNQRIY